MARAHKAMDVGTRLQAVHDAIVIDVARFVSVAPTNTGNNLARVGWACVLLQLRSAAVVKVAVAVAVHLHNAAATRPRLNLGSQLRASIQAP